MSTRVAATTLYTLSLHDALPISTIADSYDQGINPLPTTATHAPGEVTHRVVLRGPGGAPVPAGKLSLIWATKAAAYVGCPVEDRKSTRLNSSHSQISYAVFCLKK